jgi:hypothetical protein
LTVKLLTGLSSEGLLLETETNMSDYHRCPAIGLSRGPVQHHRSFYAGWRNVPTRKRHLVAAHTQGGFPRRYGLHLSSLRHPMTNPKQIVAVAAPPGFSDVGHDISVTDITNKSQLQASSASIQSLLCAAVIVDG